MTKLTTLVNELHKRIKTIQDNTVFTDSKVQKLYAMFRRGQIDTYESTIKLINKIYKTNYPSEVKK